MNKFVEFVNECVSELKKVVWPDWNQARDATLVVIFSLIILTVIVYVFDHLYIYSINRILG